VLSSSLAGKASIARTLWTATNSGCHPESLLVPDILVVCTSLEALACNVGVLEALCSQPNRFSRPHAHRFRLTLIASMRFPWSHSVDYSL
jgi:hypothetical protein